MIVKKWVNLSYLGDKGDHLTKSLIRKLNKCFDENVKFTTSNVL